MADKLKKLRMPEGKPLDDPEEEAIRQRALKFQKEQAGPEFEDKPEEEGAVEGDLEDIVPYGSTISMVTPMGAGKKLARKGAKELAEHTDDIVKLGWKGLAKLKDKVPTVEKKLIYGTTEHPREALRAMKSERMSLDPVKDKKRIEEINAFLKEHDTMFQGPRSK